MGESYNDTWRTPNLSEITTKIQDGTHFSPQSKDGPCLYITSKNIKRGALDLRNVEYISQQEHDEIYKRCDVAYGDILLTKDGANTGNLAINYLNVPFSLLSSVAFIRTNEEFCDNKYLFQTMQSVDCQQQIVDVTSGNAITRITLNKIKELTVPLPPLPEQKKIATILTSVVPLSKKHKRKSTN